MSTVPPPHRTNTALMLMLTFSTGIVDAVGYLGLDRVFTGNMTGNIAILGMGLAGADGLPVIGPLVALAGFFVGAAVAGRVLRSAAPGWTAQTTVLLIGVTAILTLGATLSTLTPAQRSWPDLLTVLLGAAMGMQAGAARTIAVKDITTVVVTSTLVGLAFESRLAASSSQLWVRRALAVAFIGLGALTGALLLHLHFGLGIAVAALLTLAVVLIGETTRRRRAPDTPGTPTHTRANA